jgi:hypothetical protein
MASSTPKTIILSDQPTVQAEYKAASVALTPGDLVELASATTIQLHATQAGNAQAMFVTENPFQVTAGVAAIDDPYGTADTVYCLIGKSGDHVYGWLQPGGSVNAGDFVESAGSLGSLQAYAVGTAEATHSIVAKALEAKTATTARVRVKVEVV